MNYKTVSGTLFAENKEQAEQQAVLLFLQANDLPTKETGVVDKETGLLFLTHTMAEHVKWWRPKVKEVNNLRSNITTNKSVMKKQTEPATTAVSTETATPTPTVPLTELERKVNALTEIGKRIAECQKGIASMKDNPPWFSFNTVGLWVGVETQLTELGLRVGTNNVSSPSTTSSKGKKGKANDEDIIRVVTENAPIGVKGIADKLGFDAKMLRPVIIQLFKNKRIARKGTGVSTKYVAVS